MKYIRAGIAQINTTVGDLDGNTRKIIQFIKEAKRLKINLITFPELAITGYPPKDLLLKTKFIKENQQRLQDIVKETEGIIAIVGFVHDDGDVFNSAAVIHDRKIIGIQHKIHLPNYGVFDEKRYFKAGRETFVFETDTVVFGVSICEDIWVPGFPTENQCHAGAELIINISASPYHIGKPDFRKNMFMTRASDNIVNLIFNNLVGGQDDLVFDGNGLLIDCSGNTIAEGKLFKEDLVFSDISLEDVKRTRLRDPRAREFQQKPENFNVSKVISRGKTRISTDRKLKQLDVRKNPFLVKKRVVEKDPFKEIYDALVLGVGDYVRKNGFKKVVIGLSGGIDSSITATIAVDALGAENVVGIAMPSHISSRHSLEDAQELAKNLKIKLEKIPIYEVYKSYIGTLFPVFKGTKPGITEENLQARIRGNILMAFSNKFGYLLLTTGNKSELSMGYTTLYGDMAGGFAVISDVPKTLVYELSKYRNSMSKKPQIPERCLTKEPSAELRSNQKDTDSLPDYNILDGILHLCVELDKSIEEIVALGYEEKIVKDVVIRVDRNEYKRQQAAPGIRITPKAFGSGRRIPITNKFRG